MPDVRRILSEKVHGIPDMQGVEKQEKGGAMTKDSSTMKFIKGLLKESGVKCIELKGKCQSCERVVSIVIWEEGFEIEGNGGVIVGKAWNDMPEFKCSECLERDHGMISPQRTEIFSRVCGYLRPVGHWNPGKKAEFKDRINYKLT